MSMQTDVKSTAIAAAQTNAAVFAGPARIKGMVVSVPSAGGTLSLKDGSGGTTMFSFVAPAAAGAVNVVIPGEGDRKSTRLNSSHMSESRMPSSA